jgi:hypothetical protein
VLAALDIATSGSSKFIEELSPLPPWNLYLGLQWAADTHERPPVERVRVEKIVEKAPALARITGIQRRLDDLEVLDTFHRLPPGQLEHYLRVSALEFVVSATQRDRVGIVMEHCEGDLGRMLNELTTINVEWIHQLLVSLAEDSAVIFEHTGLIQADLKLQNVFYTADPASAPARRGYFLIGDLGGFCPGSGPEAPELRSRATYRRRGIEKNGVPHLSFQRGFMLLSLLLRNGPRREDLRRQGVRDENGNRRRPVDVQPSFMEWIDLNTARMQRESGLDVAGLWRPRAASSAGMGFGLANAADDENAPPNYEELSQWFNSMYGQSDAAKGGLRNYLIHNLQVEYSNGDPANWDRARTLSKHFADYVEALILRPISDMGRLVEKTKDMMRIFMEDRIYSR